MKETINPVLLRANEQLQEQVAALKAEVEDWKGRAANERASGLMTAQELTREREISARLREALETMIYAGREAYDNGYPEMERAVVIAREALAGDSGDAKQDGGNG